MTEKLALKDRDRVIVYAATGDPAIPKSLVEEARGILISIKEDKAYVLPDGMKTIKVWPVDLLVLEPVVRSETASQVVIAMLCFLRNYYTAQKAEGFKPGQNTRIECIEYLIKEESEK